MPKARQSGPTRPGSHYENGTLHEDARAPPTNPFRRRRRISVVNARRSSAENHRLRSPCLIAFWLTIFLPRNDFGPVLFSHGLCLPMLRWRSALSSFRLSFLDLRLRRDGMGGL